MVTKSFRLAAVPLALGLALAAGICWALYIVFGQRVAMRYGGMATPLGMLAAALVVAPIGVFHAGSALFDPQWLMAGLAVALPGGFVEPARAAHAGEERPQPREVVFGQQRGGIRPRDQAFAEGAWVPLAGEANFERWTDDYASTLPVLIWKNIIGGREE